MSEPGLLTRMVIFVVAVVICTAFVGSFWAAFDYSCKVRCDLRWFDFATFLFAVVFGGIPTVVTTLIVTFPIGLLLRQLTASVRFFGLLMITICTSIGLATSHALWLWVSGELRSESSSFDWSNLLGESLIFQFALLPCIFFALLFGWTLFFRGPTHIAQSETY